MADMRPASLFADLTGRSSVDSHWWKSQVGVGLTLLIPSFSAFQGQCTRNGWGSTTDDKVRFTSPVPVWVAGLRLWPCNQGGSPVHLGGTARGQTGLHCQSLVRMYT
jgi:hypothetical protein